MSEINQQSVERFEKLIKGFENFRVTVETETGTDDEWRAVLDQLRGTIRNQNADFDLECMIDASKRRDPKAVVLAYLDGALNYLRRQHGMMAATVGTFASLGISGIEIV